ncbi:MAG: S9 family peptidase [Gammaproteobacteria bacterium]
MTAAKTPYGRWTSPITSESVASEALRFAQPSMGGTTAFWIETRPAEGGRSVLMRQRDASAAEDLTPLPMSVRSRANEYGGGAYAVLGDSIWFVNDEDQQVYHLGASGAPVRVTESTDARWADLRPDPHRRRLLAIRERHGAGAEPENALVAIDSTRSTVDVLAEGHDFYASPRLSPDGRRLAWLAWDHPHLPWTGTQLWIASLSVDGRAESRRQIPAGARTSIFQPEFAPDGSLCFMSDASGWWNLWRWDGHSAQQIVREPAELGLPQWQFGMSTYGFIDARAALCARVRDGRWSVIRVSLDSGRVDTLNLPYTDIEHLSVAGRFAVLQAGTPDRALGIVRLDTATGGYSTVRAVQPAAVDSAAVSEPLPIEFDTGEGATAHGFYYPPRNPAHVAPWGERPPLRVKCHGGPTGAASTALDPRVQYWTSRGWALLDVDYRGSTGYGRDYREQLYGRWGEADVEDCASGVRFLADEGLADARRATISGNSAGGYTVLCALAFTDAFSAGASYYGVADPATLFAATHKFEAHYDRWLFGAERERLLVERSPLAHADRIRCPVIFFQGSADKVVPPEQTARMVAAMQAAGTDVACLTFDGEGHGFRGADAIRRALEAEHEFLSRVLEPAAIRSISPRVRFSPPEPG